jgi:phenylpyruvate tautomerase PptA (4-oxalocrotonate tautomerase family)
MDMPVITVDWWQGHTRERRAVLVSELAATTARVTGCPPEDIVVIVRDCEPGHSAALGGGDCGTASPHRFGSDEPPLDETRLDDTRPW